MPSSAAKITTDYLPQDRIHAALVSLPSVFLALFGGADDELLKKFMMAEPLGDLRWHTQQEVEKSL